MDGEVVGCIVCYGYRDHNYVILQCRKDAVGSCSAIIPGLSVCLDCPRRPALEDEWVFHAVNSEHMAAVHRHIVSRCDMRFAAMLEQ